MIESWMISLGSVVVSFIAMLAVLRHKTNEQESKILRLFKVSDEHTKELVKIAMSCMTSKDVDEKYVSKEYFKQVEKHIDAKFEAQSEKFDRLANGQEKIIHLMENIVRRGDINHE